MGRGGEEEEEEEGGIGEGRGRVGFWLCMTAQDRELYMTDYCNCIQVASMDSITHFEVYKADCLRQNKHSVSESNFTWRHLIYAYTVHSHSDIVQPCTLYYNYVQRVLYCRCQAAIAAEQCYYTNVSYKRDVE